MTWSLRWRLSLMMFLQYAIWGAWAPVLSATLEQLGFSGVQMAFIYSLLPLACIISPFLGGQIADRWLPTQHFLALAHLAGGVTMLFMARQDTLAGMVPAMLVFTLLYAPTLPLTNSLSFHHLRNVEKEFGGIRVWGTLGWIAIGWALTAWRRQFGMTVAGMIDCLAFAGVAALVMAGFCMLLPHTPPRREAENPLAFVAALKLLRDRNFLIFMAISFIVVTELQFYYMLTAPFLQHIGIAQKNVPATMTIAQIAEVVMMAFALPYFLPRLGVARALAIGVIAWPIRYIVFAIGQPVWLVAASLAMHGIGYTFFFVVGQIYVNSAASDDIRASAQSLLTLITLGLGNYLGTFFAGWIRDVFTVKDAAGAMVSINYTGVFLVPCAITILCAVAFLVAFRPQPAARTAEA